MNQNLVLETTLFQKQLAAREAQLLQIINGEDCECTHDNEDCCVKVGSHCAKCIAAQDPPAALRAYVEGLLPAKHAEIEHFDGWNACIEQVRENLNKSLEGK